MGRFTGSASSSAGRLALLLVNLSHALITLASASNDGAVVLADATASTGRKLETTPAHCHPLSKDLLTAIAQENHVLISVMDELVWHVYGKSWVTNVQSAGITYWVSARILWHGHVRRCVRHEASSDLPC